MHVLHVSCAPSFPATASFIYGFTPDAAGRSKQRPYGGLVLRVPGCWFSDVSPDAIERPHASGN